MSNKERSPGRRSQVESERTRRRVLDRAERLFARKGYRGVSLRELARASGVRPFTIQHHFGSKLGLYQTVLCRWDGEVLDRVSRRLDSHPGAAALVRSVVDDLFDFFLSKRDWMALNARAVLGEGLPKGVVLEDRSWVRFVETAMRERKVGTLHLDPGLLLITVDGILNNHVLSATHYRHLFGRDVTDPDLKARTKRHIESVILALLGRRPARARAAPSRPPKKARRGNPWPSSSPTRV